MFKKSKLKYIGSLSIILIIGLLSSSFRPVSENDPGSSPRVKKIILMIGDGMGIAQLSATMTVTGNNLNMTRAKHIGFMSTQSADDYTTDSAASGTAISTGEKTKNGMIGMNPDSLNIKLITEKIRKEKDMSFGVVSTSAVTHATPASFVAHNISRTDYEGIALDFVRNHPEVFIGGGKDHFVNRKDHRDLVKVLERKDYDVVFTLDELLETESDKVAGLLADIHMPRLSEGRDNMLALSTKKAIEILDRNNNGFFLMVEGSQIDWGGHSNDAVYVVEETFDFDRAVGVALEYAEQDKNTLVIVTADHETGGMTIAGGNNEDNSVLANFASTSHTGIIVPVFAFGAQAEVFTGFYENTELFEKMSEVLRLR